MTDREPQEKKLKVTESCAANSAVSIRIVNDASNWESETKFHPAFTYHAFGKEEIIYGYHGLQILLTFNARTFDCLVEITYDDKDIDAEDLISRMENSLPKGFTQDKQAFIATFEGTSQKPPGTLADSFTNDGKDYATYFAILKEDSAAKKYLEKLQKISLWFIEGADDIDVNDPRWSLYVIYDTVEGRHSPVGYITVFTFNTPLKSQSMGQSMRICQALILPPYQRQGLGEKLVEHIMHQARSSHNVFEVTVEDPVPGFSKLRDVVDVKTCLSHGFFSLSPTEIPQSSAHGTKSLSNEDIEAVRHALKLTRHQIQRCYEMLKLRFVDRTDDEAYKAFRLEVKRRLHKQHAEELEEMASAERRKFLLASLYEELERDYDSTLKRCGLGVHDISH